MSCPTLEEISPKLQQFLTRIRECYLIEWYENITNKKRFYSKTVQNFQIKHGFTLPTEMKTSYNDDLNTN